MSSITVKNLLLELDTERKHVPRILSDLRLRGKDVWMSNKNLNWTLDECLHLEVIRKLSISYTTTPVVTVVLFLCVLDVIRGFVPFCFFTFWRQYLTCVLFM